MKFMLRSLEACSIELPMPAANGLALESGMNKMVLPATLLLSIGGPGATNLGSAVYWSISAFTAARLASLAPVVLPPDGAWPPPQLTRQKSPIKARTTPGLLPKSCSQFPAGLMTALLQNRL